MKVFISADIEGTAFTMNWPATNIGGHDYERSRQEMTEEVLAAAEGAHAAGADLVVIKDAHASATNIYAEQMPEYVQLIRGWSREPRKMIEGLDETFDAAFFIGYHSAAGLDGNVLSHTINGSVIHSIRVNGTPASEFMIYSMLASYYGVPSVLLTGDKALCEFGKEFCPDLTTVAVKEDVGGRSQLLSPALVKRRIREAATQALQGNLKQCLIDLPEYFEVEVTYRDHNIAYSRSFYPGASLINPTTVGFASDDWYEVNRFLLFVI